MTVNATNELQYILNHWCRQSLPPVTAPKHFFLYFAIIPTPRLFNYPLLHAPTQGSHQHYLSFLSLHLFTYPTSFILPSLHFFTFFIFSNNLFTSIQITSHYTPFPSILSLFLQPDLQSPLLMSQTEDLLEHVQYQIKQSTAITPSSQTESLSKHPQLATAYS